MVKNKFSLLTIIILVSIATTNNPMLKKLAKIKNINTCKTFSKQQMSTTSSISATPPKIIKVYSDDLLAKDEDSIVANPEAVKQLAKEIQCRDFDALIAHTSIVFMRYMFLAYQCRMQTDQRTFGDLFYACCDEVADISFMQAIYRILTLAADRLKQLDAFCEKTATAFFDTVMNTALQCVGLSKNNLQIG